ncbi:MULTISPECIES: hypothetical protein [unclassified Streptomyces]|uniref:hypothetical protein n=1 Tax=unclassified Streptomyces TaxID=2593676 RepID=UPI00224D2B82|nr:MULTISPECIES: hypothetical protein [unclassified Streptomyces]MCX5147726.1 hypothetical protein [Streptomyces sp. NBC_00320]WSN50841.1 hypothetical protein OG299_25765 [Streptomyces sp. NBC_01296]
MLIEVSRFLRRRWLPQATVAVAAGAAGLAGVVPAAAAQVTTVSCSANPNALQPAITAASPGDTLLVRGTCTGPFTIDKDLTLRGVGGAVLDGNQAGSTVTVGSGARVLLDHVILTHGSAASSGGGVDNEGTLTVSHSTVRDNTAPSGAGGGIHNLGTLTVVSSTVRDNYSIGAGGGINNNGSLTVRDSSVFGNSGDNGGGIFNYLAGQTVTLIRSSVHHNTARVSDGGGILNYMGEMTVSGSTVYSNTAPFGGGIWNQGTLTVTRSTVQRNTATGGPGSGGGIYKAGGSLTLDRSVVRNNTPDNCAPPGSVLGCTG